MKFNAEVLLVVEAASIDAAEAVAEEVIKDALRDAAKGLTTDGELLGATVEGIAASENLDVVIARMEDEGLV